MYVCSTIPFELSRLTQENCQKALPAFSKSFLIEFQAGWHEKSARIKKKPANAFWLEKVAVDCNFQAAYLT